MRVAAPTRAFLLVLFLIISFVAPAAAREEIRSFVSDVTLLTNGSVDVTETIEVNVEGAAIRRGIFRDIPTVLINPDGSRLRSGLAVVGVSRDGRDEPFAVEAITNGTRIRIGDPDVLLTHGPHRYVIRYTMTRMARYFTDHDELFWNATGNFWDFPILAATANVTLPAGSVISQLAGYTGQLGSAEQAVTTRRTSATTATFVADRVLAPGEGMSVAAAFQKGVLAQPTGIQQALYWFSDRRDVILPLAAVALLLLYNVLAWDAVGRDPQKGTIIPLFHPPKGFSPALTHYVHEMGFKQNGWTAFTASLIDLGVKGLLTISKSGKTTTLTATDKPAGKLPGGEQGLLDFIQQRGNVVVNTATGPQLNLVREHFIQALESENRRVYFNHNRFYVVVGALLSLAFLGALVLLGVLDPVWLMISTIAGIVIGLGSTLFQRNWLGRGFSTFVVIGWIAIASTNVVSGLAGLFTNFSVSTGAVAAASIVAINIVFGILLRAPTVQGRKVMDEIEGFKMYLETAEQHRLNMHGVPEMTVTRFERILPYAIALGVEKPWSEHFEAELSRHAVAGVSGTSYSPVWYHGSGGAFSPSRIGSDVAGIGTAMSAAMIASQPQAATSSGFSGGGGGGGGSGGGGGGGGGGGW